MKFVFHEKTLALNLKANTLLVKILVMNFSELKPDGEAGPPRPNQVTIIKTSITVLRTFCTDYDYRLFSTDYVFISRSKEKRKGKNAKLNWRRRRRENKNEYRRKKKKRSLKN